jgi:hypothetical protein
VKAGVPFFDSPAVIGFAEPTFSLQSKNQSRSTLDAKERWNYDAIPRAARSMVPAGWLRHVGRSAGDLKKCKSCR